MVILRSGSTTESDFTNMTEPMTSDQFALFLIEACKSLDIKKMIKDIVAPKHDDFMDIVSAEVHRQMLPFRQQLQEKDQEILTLKKTIADQQVQLDDLEQHGRRDSLRVSGIPEPEEYDGTDAAVMSVCTAMKLDPPLDPKDIAVSHRVGRKVQGMDRQIVVKFATRNVRERVFRARKALKDVNQDKDVGKKIYINEDLTKFRAGLAREARSYKNSGLINDTWSIYGKIMAKDNHGHVSVIRTYEDLVKSSEQGNRGHRREAGGQGGTADGRPGLNS